ncbi:MAG: hypothetical protein U1E65_21580 [Myxococcota bacterium]
MVSIAKTTPFQVKGTPTGAAPSTPPPTPTVAKPKADADTYVPPKKGPATKEAAYNANPADYFGDLKSLDAKKFSKIKSDPPGTAKEIPAHVKAAEEAMEKKDYKTAAAEMNKMGDKEFGPIDAKMGGPELATADAYEAEGGKAARVKTLKSQANCMAKMEAAIGRKPNYPPSKEDLKDYFKTLKGKDSATVQGAWQEYADAFHVHAGKRGDVTYSDKHAPEESLPPNRPIESKDSARPWDGGKTINDCEGYAALAGMCFKEAGYTPKFVGATNTTAAGAKNSHMIVVASKAGEKPIYVSSQKSAVVDSEKEGIDEGFKAVGYGKKGDTLIKTKPNLSQEKASEELGS